MGNYYCKKCGVCVDYYNDINIDRPSCRVVSEYERYLGIQANCRHDFVYRSWLSTACALCEK